MTYPKAITKKYLKRELDRLKDRHHKATGAYEQISLEGSIVTIRKLLHVLDTRHPDSRRRRVA
jgi:hypothetical protein